MFLANESVVSCPFRDKRNKGQAPSKMGGSRWRAGVAVVGGVALLSLLLLVVGRSGDSPIRHGAEEKESELLSLTTTANTDWSVKQAFFTFSQSQNPVVKAMLESSDNETLQHKEALCHWLQDMSDVISEMRSERTIEMIRSMDEEHRDAALAALQNASSAGNGTSGNSTGAESPTQQLLAKYGCGNMTQNESLSEVEEEEHAGEASGAAGVGACKHITERSDCLADAKCKFSTARGCEAVLGDGGEGGKAGVLSSRSWQSLSSGGRLSGSGAFSWPHAAKGGDHGQSSGSGQLSWPGSVTEHLFGLARAGSGGSKSHLDTSSLVSRPKQVRERDVEVERRLKSSKTVVREERNLGSQERKPSSLKTSVVEEKKLEPSKAGLEEEKKLTQMVAEQSKEIRALAQMVGKSKAPLVPWKEDEVASSGFVLPSMKRRKIQHSNNR